MPIYSEKIVGTYLLGLIFDKHLNSHLNQKLKSVNSRLHLLRPLFKSKFSLAIKLTVYKSIRYPLGCILYGIQLCGPVKPLND